MDEEDFVIVQHQVDEHIPSSNEPKYLSEISDFIDKTSNELWAVNAQIHDNPELGFEEYKAHALLTNFLKARDGWKVTPSAYGMATAWVAVYDSGRKGPVVSFNLEMGTSWLPYLRAFIMNNW
jgi:hypothetical protein